MLLIQSDMMKALWLVICPLAIFAAAPISSDSAFCQVSGFLLAVSIEASDFAVLLIAIHTTMTIFVPSRLIGAAGLYPYRKIAYTCWILIPICLASVVPLSGGRFVDNGPHCYLPVQPTWYRKALDWIPRYIVFAVIFFTYVSLYLYLDLQVRRFGRDQRRASITQGHYSNQTCRNNHCHSHKKGGSEGSQQSVASTLSTMSAPRRVLWRLQRKSIELNSVDFRRPNSFELQARWDSGAPIETHTLPSQRAQVTTTIPVPDPVHHLSVRCSQQSDHSHFPSKRWASSHPHGIAIVSNSVCLSHENDEAMRHSREKQLRQLRLLFVYPVIYLLTWIAPFVSHVVRYNDDYVYDEPPSGIPPPLSLRIASVVSLSIGAALDCCFFTAWEKPWLHTRGGFWECLALWLSNWMPRQHGSIGVGRTRDERSADARAARFRRDREEDLENLSSEAAHAVRREPRYGSQHNTAPREWWDAVDVDRSETSIASSV
ncbi:G protein-coupled glucose receptor regulating Gpa2-domain-containing protein [Hypoxylon sp. NC1633]|nr:G protein-coupled glucose receptor regulating Gpa2-domain-containing protein [Hypoxylon sp. NC1633]